MSDDLKNPGPEDGKRISLTEAHEVAYWTKALNITEEQLGKAVAAVGHMAKDVRIYLDGQERLAHHTSKGEIA